MWQGKYNEAESLFREEVAILKRALGDSHPAVAKALSYLAPLLKDQVSILSLFLLNN
jgi:hypothetical protein